MKKSLIIFNISSSTNIEYFKSKILDSFDQIEEGRYILVTYDVPFTWAKSICWEGILNEVFRTSSYVDKFWSFFGSGTIRYYQMESSALLVTSNWLLYRKPGDKPYKRAKIIKKELLEFSKLDSLHKVFTRDVANNVWHFWINDKSSSAFDRFAGLLMWPDEEGQIITETETLNLKNRKLKLDKNVVGVPTKIPYKWVDEK